MKNSKDDGTDTDRKVHCPSWFRKWCHAPWVCLVFGAGPLLLGFGQGNDGWDSLKFVILLTVALFLGLILTAYGVFVLLKSYKNGELPEGTGIATLLASLPTLIILLRWAFLS